MPLPQGSGFPGVRGFTKAPSHRPGERRSGCSVTPGELLGTGYFCDLPLYNIFQFFKLLVSISCPIFRAIPSLLTAAMGLRVLFPPASLSPSPLIPEPCKHQQPPTTCRHRICTSQVRYDGGELLPRAKIKAALQGRPQTAADTIASFS